MATKCACKTSDLLVRDVRVALPAVTDEMVRLEMLNAVRDFCHVSLAVRGDTKDTLTAGSDELVMADSDEGMEVIRVLSLRANGQLISPVPALRLVSGQYGYWCNPPNNVHFAKPAEQDTDIDGVVALAPGTVCNTACLPDVLAGPYYEAIRAGTLGRLYMQIGKAYSNLNLGQMMMQRANARALWARVTADQADTMGQPPWVFPRWAR